MASLLLLLRFHRCAFTRSRTHVKASAIHRQLAKTALEAPLQLEVERCRLPCTYA